MVSPLVPENSRVTTHKYRPLDCAKLFKSGSGTRELSLLTLSCIQYLTQCIIVFDPFWVELPAYALEGEWVQRFRGGRRPMWEAMLTPKAGFHEAAPDNHKVTRPCFVAGPACMQAKDWVREQETNKLLRVQYFWPSERLKQFCEPGRTLRTQTIKGSGMDDYKSMLQNQFCASGSQAYCVLPANQWVLVIPTLFPSSSTTCRSINRIFSSRDQLPGLLCSGISTKQGTPTQEH